MSKGITVPYCKTLNVGYPVVYDQEDANEFTELYDLMDHANKKQISLLDRIKELEEEIKFIKEVGGLCLVVELRKAKALKKEL